MVVAGWLSRVAISGALLALGCRTDVHMAPESRTTLRTIHFSREFSGAEKPYVADGGLATFGLIGAAVSISQLKTRQDQLMLVLQDNQIDVREMVYERLVERLLIAGYAPARDASAADATLRLWIDWGLGEPGDPAERLRPLLQVAASLEDRDGRVVWRSRRGTRNLSGRPPGHAFDEYVASPELLREEFSGTAGAVVKMLADALAAESP